MSVGNSTNRFAVANLIVAPTIAEGAEYTTITSALSASVSGDTIFIKDGTYTEDLILKSGVNLTSFISKGSSTKVIIIGKLSVSFSGVSALTGLSLRTNGDNLMNVSGSNSSALSLNECLLNALDATGIVANAANCSISFYNCIFNATSPNLMFNITTISGMAFHGSITSGGTGVNLIAAGTVAFYQCRVGNCSITTSTTGAVTCYNSTWLNIDTNAITTAGTGTSRAYNSSFFTGTATTFSIGSGTVFQISDCPVTSSNANVIGGAGTLTYSNINMLGSSDVISTTTQTGKYAELGKYRAKSQPAFLAFLGTTDLNATGDGTNFQIGSGNALTEVIDQGGDFNTNGTFTAPVTGNYFLQEAIFVNGGTDMIGHNFYINTSNRTYRQDGTGGNITTAAIKNQSTLADMDTGDTATFSIVTVDSGGKIDDIFGSAAPFTWCSGKLEC